MLERIGLMFSGQGSQVTGLGRDFYEKYESFKNLYDDHPHIRDLSFYADEIEIAKTQNTQRILLLFQIAVVDLLKEFIKFDAAMGMSLGEYAALYCADSLSREDVIRIVEARADSMAEVSSGLSLSSIAVLNDGFEWLEENDGRGGYYISNINSATQQIITGENLASTVEKLNELGYKKCMNLNVTGGFHSPYMKKTQDFLSNFFQQFDFKNPQIPIFFNYGGEDMELKERMAKQVSNKIDVHNSLVQIEKNCDILLEIGANKVLEKLMSKINKSKKVFKIHTVEDFEKVRKLWKIK